MTILRHLAKLGSWDQALNPLLDAALRDLPRYAGSEGAAWALLAQLKAGAVELDDLLSRLPSSFSGTYHDARRERKQIAAALQELKSGADSSTKRRLSRAIRKLDV